MFSDITERKQTEEQIQLLAYYDVLTGLPNRLLFNDRLKQVIGKSNRNQYFTALFFIDMDNFKVINDTLGHFIGDKFLRIVSKRLKEQVREEDTVARLGGDEFTIILENITSYKDVAVIANNIVKSLSYPFILEKQEMFSSASIGISVFPNDGRTPQELIKKADTAMYHVKDRGKSDYSFFTKKMNEKASELLKYDADIRHAVFSNEFVLYYQPQITIETGLVVGCEALIRWNHRTLGMLYPDKFISIAEKSNMIEIIGNWVLETACKQRMLWENSDYPQFRVAINLSAKQLRQKTFVATVKQILEETGIDPQLLELELTESAIMQNTEEAIIIMQKLKDIGISFSIDDFGTGYSSLNYLKRLPLDKVKIDYSFVRDITTDTDDRTITKAIIDLSHSMNLKVIAEGVETKEQLDFLRKNGCDEAQGYYYHKPLGADEFPKIFQQVPDAVV